MARREGSGTDKRQPNQAFLVYRRSVGTQQEAAEHLNAVATSLGINLGCTVQQIRRLENGTTRWPTQPYIRVLTAASGHTMEELGFPARRDRQASYTADTVRDLPPGAAQEGGQSGEPHESGNTDVKRRAFLHSSAALALPIGMPPLPTPSTASPPAAPLAAPPDTSWARPIYEAVLSPLDALRRSAPQTASAKGPQSPLQLRRAVGKAMDASLASDYARLTEALPALIGHIELAHLQGREADRPHIQQLLSDVYAVAGWTLIKADSAAAAWMAAQRAVQLADDAGDMPRSAAATRCLAEVHMRAGHFEEAGRSAFVAATCLDLARTDEPATARCLRGAALLSAAAAAARRGDRREAHIALRSAAACADELGQDRVDLATVFGPTNVAIHQVAVAVELGDPHHALEHAPKVTLSRIPDHLAERRGRFLIDVARSHAAVQDSTAALEVLLKAEQIAPDEVRHHRLTHQLVHGLLTRERRSSPLRAFADRCNLLT